MNDKSENWTWGFEIEGLFSYRLIDKLENGDFEIDIKRDGSVNTSEIMRENNVRSDGLTGSEMNIGIFQNSVDMLKALALFKNADNYFMDKSCGLHLHIKPKFNIKQSKELFWDLKLIKKLEKYSFSELCQCVKDRENNRFCGKYGSFDNFYSEFKRQEKYRFVRNHPSGTMEFRFLSPCPHKVDNVEKFITFMLESLEKQEHKKSAVISLESRDEEIIDNITFVLAYPDKNENYSYRLGEDFTKRGSPRRRIANIFDEIVEHEEDEDSDDGDGER